MGWPKDHQFAVTDGAEGSRLTEGRTRAGPANPALGVCMCGRRAQPLCSGGSQEQGSGSASPGEAGGAARGQEQTRGKDVCGSKCTPASRHTPRQGPNAQERRRICLTQDSYLTRFVPGTPQQGGSPSTHPPTRLSIRPPVLAIQPFILPSVHPSQGPSVCQALASRANSPSLSICSISKFRLS